ALKEGGRGTTEGLRRNRMRSLLVVAEVALSLVLLIGAGLLARSFVGLLRTDPGFDPSRVVTLDIPLDRRRYDTPERQAAFFARLIERTKALPGVEAAGLVSDLPLGNMVDELNFQIAGRPPLTPGQQPVAHYTVGTHGYFDALKIPLRQGRTFSARDGQDAPQVTIVSEALARKYFAGEDPVGRRIVTDPAVPPFEIVGVVGDARRTPLETAAGPEFYVPYEQAAQRRMNLVVRTSAAEAAGMGAALRG